MDRKPPPNGRPDANRREPLWDRVDKNRVRLAAYVALFVVSAVVVFDVLFLLFSGCALITILIRVRAVSEIEWLSAQDPLALMLAPSLVFASFALGWALFTLSRSERWLLRRFRAVLVPKGELIETKMALKDMAIASGLSVAPALYLLDSTNVNAFVFAARKRRAVIGVTSGLVGKLTIEQQRAVLANLVARIKNGDVTVDTGVTALLWPLHAWRDRQIYRQNYAMDQELSGSDRYRDGDPGSVLLVFFFGVALALVGEAFAYGHRRKQLKAAEKADAEAMLLLKDPHAMLSALERCIELDNVVTVAGEAFADLFYCWTGDSTNDEDDPEWARVARLREVLGVEGYVAVDEPLHADPVAPVAPRLPAAESKRLI